jgi:protein-S-isoprenylcysteine O-methyltransferase Ste14
LLYASLSVATGNIVKLANLVGAGDRIVAMAVPFVCAGIAANVAWPHVFRMGLGLAGLVVGSIMAAVGAPLWLWAVGQILLYVPRGRLITSGPFALVLHPIYTFVSLLVLPGIGLVVDSWMWFTLGGALYLGSRLFAPREEKQLARDFPGRYAEYRAQVLLPWL